MEMAGKMSVFGNCVIKNVRQDADNRVYKVNDNLGFGTVAAKAGLTVEDFSRLGCPVTRAWDYIQKMFPRIDGDLVFMDFGARDSVPDLEAVSKYPLEKHGPVTDLEDFLSVYDRIIDYTMERRRMPVLATLVPVDANIYIDYMCRTRGLNRDNIMRWLGNGYSRIGDSVRLYSDAVRELAFRREVPLIDIRQAFLEQGKKASLLGPDGIRPNAEGRQVIHGCFERFVFDYMTF